MAGTCSFCEGPSRRQGGCMGMPPHCGSSDPPRISPTGARRWRTGPLPLRLRWALARPAARLVVTRSCESFRSPRELGSGRAWRQHGASARVTANRSDRIEEKSSAEPVARPASQPARPRITQAALRKQAPSSAAPAWRLWPRVRESLRPLEETMPVEPGSGTASQAVSRQDSTPTASVTTLPTGASCCSRGRSSRSSA